MVISKPPPVTSHNTSMDFEIALYRAIAQARPVGVHKHFQVLAMQHSMSIELQEDVGVNEIWSKLASLYNLEELDNQVGFAYRHQLPLISLAGFGRG